MHVRGGSPCIYHRRQSLRVRGEITPPRTPAFLHRIFYRQGAHLAPVLPLSSFICSSRTFRGRAIRSVATQRRKFGPFSPGNTTFTLKRRGNFISYLSYVRYRLWRVCPWDIYPGFYRVRYLYSFGNLARFISRRKIAGENILKLKVLSSGFFHCRLYRVISRAVRDGNNVNW